VIQDEIIHMAREAGFVVTIHGESNGYTTLEIRFNPDKLGDYAAPVRTKDLTDDVCDEIIKSAENKVGVSTNGWDCVDPRFIVRAVIAADREKNK